MALSHQKAFDYNNYCKSEIISVMVAVVMTVGAVVVVFNIRRHLIDARAFYIALLIFQSWYWCYQSKGSGGVNIWSEYECLQKFWINWQNNFHVW